MEKRKGKIAAGLIFILLFLLLFSLVSIVFVPHGSSSVTGFYEEPENSVDVLFIGSSPALYGFSPLVLWHEHGITSYNRAWSLQAPYISYNFVQETLETQSPRLVVFFVPKFFEPYNVDTAEPFIREGIDYLPFSRYKLNIIAETLRASEKQRVWDYMFPLLRYHDRWRDDLSGRDRFIDEKLSRSPSVYRGEYPHYTGVTAYEDFDLSLWDEKAAAAEISEYSLEYVLKIAELLDEEGIEFLIVEMPRIAPEYGRHRAYMELAGEYGLDVLDLSVPEVMAEMGLDPATAFTDESHLSAFGAETVTEYFGEYLKENHELPDHRGESGSERWNADYEKRMRESREALEKLTE